ncbi:MAG: phage terminase large subunit family protein [Fidelibacterota bacterium]|nr:MAG: phage terminase large subunit family protein [Candidatus Neomarinimicrobiota bacterium]
MLSRLKLPIPFPITLQSFRGRFFVDRKLNSAEKWWDFAEFLANYVRIDNRPYSFDRHRPLLEIARRLPRLREVWLLKGAQVGLSTLAVAWCLFLSLSRGYSAGYALPTKVFARRFLKTRFRGVIAGSALLGDAVSTTENVGLMTVAAAGRDRGSAASHLYMLGLENLTDAISISLDALAFDEVDVLNRENLAWVDDRIAASPFRQKLYFSVGMNPGLGIDAGYQATSQRVWLVRCPACRRDDQVLEELFPECVRRLDGAWQRVCVGCGRPLTVQETGRWVARHPDRDVEGYRVPQLIVPGVSLDYVMRRWERARHRRSLLAKFRSSTLALPDAGERQRITAGILAGVLAPYPVQAAAEWSVGGADVGDTCCVAFADLSGGASRTGLSGERLRFIRLEPVPSDSMVPRMSGLITAMGCRCFVIDARPFRTEARRLARLHPDVVVLQYFKGQGFGTGTETHDGYTYRTVSEEREDSLDAYCDLFDPGRRGILFPRCLGGTDFMDSDAAAHHLKGSQKVEALDYRLGRYVPHFRKGVDNHYLIACNNARKALVLLAAGWGPGGAGVLPLFGELK